MKLKTIAIDDTAVALLLEEFKQYASVPDDSVDTMLASMLRSALLKVQEYADTALAQTTLELTATPDDSGNVRLYEGAGRVLSVTDCEGGAVPYTTVFGTIHADVKGPVVVRYQTIPSPGDLDRLKPIVFRYATALYDGETTETLNGILNEALC